MIESVEAWVGSLLHYIHVSELDCSNNVLDI